MNVKKFIKECESGYVWAKCAVEKMSEDDIVDMRAKLQQHIINSDKWSIVLSLIAIAIAFMSLMKNNGESSITSSNVESNIATAVSGVYIVFLIVIMLTILAHTVQMWKKSQYTKALSYLNDYEHIVSFTRESQSDKSAKRYIVDIQSIDKSSLESR